MIKIEFRAMGCQIAAFIDNETPQSVHALEAVPAWFEEWEQVLSRFRPDSELNRLNAMEGYPMKTSPILWSVLRTALQAARWSGGLVVPTILNSLERAGYDRSFETLPDSPIGGPPTALTRHAVLEKLWVSDDWTAIRMDTKDHTVTLPGGVRLDLGGIAKGWAAQEAVKRLEVFGPSLVDASGDIATSGPRNDDSPWSVAITNPLNADENLDTLALRGGAVATSGIDYRRWLQNGVWKHHIIDPHTGEPAETDLMSATVAAPDLLHAETAAKVV